MLSIRKHVRTVALMAIFSTFLVAAVPRGHDGGVDNDNDNDDGDNDGPATTANSTTSSGNGTTGVANNDGAGLNGDFECPGSKVSRTLTCSALVPGADASQ